MDKRDERGERDAMEGAIDRAVASYGLAGEELPERVLRRVLRQAAAAPVRRRGWLRWAVAVPMAAALLLVGWFSFVEMRRAERLAPGFEANVPQRQPLQTPALPQQERRSGQAHSTGTRRAERSTPAVELAARPKLDIFPTPRPLSSEEAGAQIVARQSSPEQLQNFIAAQAKRDAPLTITKIEIPALEPMGPGGE